MSSFAFDALARAGALRNVLAELARVRELNRARQKSVPSEPECYVTLSEAEVEVLLGEVERLQAFERLRSGGAFASLFNRR